MAAENSVARRASRAQECAGRTHGAAVRHFHRGSDMTLHRAALVAVVFALASPAAVRAAQGACKDDVQKFCADAKGDKKKVAACLKEHQAELSPACQEHIASMKKSAEHVQKQCKGDVQKLCK